MAKEFSELVEYLDEKFIRVDQRFDKLESDFSGLLDAVDSYAKKADTYFQEWWR